MVGFGEYWQATRHPWACALFVLPLLALYECGLAFLGSPNPEALRNGADSWLRVSLSQVGLTQSFWTPILLTVCLIAWCVWRRHDYPHGLPKIWVSMAIECGLLSLIFWIASQAIWPVLNHHPFVSLPAVCHLNSSEIASMPDPALEKIVGFLGAGIYEEAVFRLLLFSGLVGLLRLACFSTVPAIVLAAAISSVAFAGAHNIGPYGEPFQSPVFLFRTAAGLFFAFLFQFRGFGIAVGAHAGYDVIVGVLIAHAE